MKKINCGRLNSIINRILYFYQHLSYQKKNKFNNYEIYNLSIDNVSTFKKLPVSLHYYEFCNSLNFENLKFQLNNKLNIFDIIYGSVSYGTFLINLSDKFFLWYRQQNIKKKIFQTSSNKLNCMDIGPLFRTPIITLKYIKINYHLHEEF